MVISPLRIGVIAQPWVPVPPTAYGGTELVIGTLCDGMAGAGHDVTLFTTGDSTCPVRRRWLFEHADPDRMGMAVLELRHVAAAYDALRDVDIVHDHTLAGLFLSETMSAAPVVATNHGPFGDDMSDLYARVSHRVPVIAISHDQARGAPPNIRVARVIHHGLDLDRYPFGAGDGDFVLFLGRMSPDKGVHTAIRAARAAGHRIVIAAKMHEPDELRYFEHQIRPLLGPDAEYLGEVGFDEKVELLSSAGALVNPIRWPEPFGLVMIESLACGTPVIGYPQGAAREIVDQGLTGYLTDTEAGLISALRGVERFSRPACRRAAELRFSADRMVTDHVAFYRDVLAGRYDESDPDGDDQTDQNAA